GAHHFARVAVLAGAIVVHPVPSGGVVSPLDITATTVYVACNGAIEGSQRGYAPNATYPGAAAPGDASGGSHIGEGGVYTPPAGSTYGSVHPPQAAGAGTEAR